MLSPRCCNRRRRQWHPTPVLLPGKSHGWRSPVGCGPWGREESDTTERLHFHFSLSCIGEGNGNPLQCSCLENPRDGGAWWAAVYGVSQSRTRLKRLSSSSSSCNRGPQTVWLQTTVTDSLIVLKARAPNQEVGRALSPLQNPGETCACFFQLLGLPCLLTCGHINPVSASVFTGPSLFCVSCPVLSFVRTSVVGFRDHLDNPRRS